MKKYYALFFSLILVAHLEGGESVKYRYGNEMFSSAEQALAKQRADNERVLEAIQPTSTPIHGRALVALPSKEELRKHYNHTRGGMGWGGMVLPTQEQLDYPCAILEGDHDALCKAVQKRGVFDEVTTVQVNDPAAASIGESDFLIYRDVDGWFVKNRRSAPQKIVIDASGLPSVPRTISFLDSLEERARTLMKSKDGL
jgi:hypothetical protein